MENGTSSTSKRSPRSSFSPKDSLVDTNATSGNAVYFRQSLSSPMDLTSAGGTHVGDDGKAWLEKSNFDLKMKVYYLEENIQKLMKSGVEHASDELRAENTSLRLQVEEKCIEMEQRNSLLLKAKTAIETLKTEINKLRSEKQSESGHLQEYESKIQGMIKQSEEMEQKYRGQIDRLENQISNMQQTIALKEALYSSAEDKTVYFYFRSRYYHYYYYCYVYSYIYCS